MWSEVAAQSLDPTWWQVNCWHSSVPTGALSARHTAAVPTPGHIIRPTQALCCTRGCWWKGQHIWCVCAGLLQGTTPTHPTGFWFVTRAHPGASCQPLSVGGLTLPVCVRYKDDSRLVPACVPRLFGVRYGGWCACAWVWPLSGAWADERVCVCVCARCWRFACLSGNQNYTGACSVLMCVFHSAG